MSSTIELDPTWAVGGKAHGGYLLRTAVEAALDADHPHPLSVSAHFLSSPAAAPAELGVARLRTGRRVASSRVSLRQEGDAKVEVLLAAGTLSDVEPYWAAEDVTAPSLPPVQDCPRSPVESPGGFEVGYFRHVDLRLDPATTRWAVGEPAGLAYVAGYVRRDDGADATPLDLLVFADALPPVTFDLGLYGWVPTVELTIHLRGLPAPGWLRISQRARLLRDGWLDEDCEIYDSTGQLVAQARQLDGYRIS